MLFANRTGQKGSGYQIFGALLAMLAAGAAYSQPRPPTLCVESATGCEPAIPASAYPWYPRFDLSSVPWHTAAGGWGPRFPLQAPAAPSTTRSVSVSSVDQFDAAAAVPGTRITINAGWAGNTVATVNASDIDIVIPSGVSIGAIQFGVYPRTTPISRVRIRGTTPGTRSGGRMGQYRDHELVSDVIIDGIDMNNDSGFPGGETNAVFRAYANRLAVVNVRAHAAGALWLGSARHVVIANSNMFHGAATRASVGYIEGWGLRNTGGPISIVDSRIQGTRYHNLRPQSVGNPGELFFATRSVFVAQAEGRTGWLWNNLGNGPWNGQGVMLVDNDIYAYQASTCILGPELSVENANWSRVANNRFYGAGAVAFDQGFLNREASRGVNGTAAHNWSEGNAFSTFSRTPAWGGPGDPREIPLPGGRSVISGEGQCPGIT